MPPGTIRQALIDGARAILPARFRSWLLGVQRDNRLQWPRAGSVDFGQLRRLTPISDLFGMDRGMPVDRYYIEAFLDRNRACIRGRVLELGDATYTRRFGDDRVSASDVLSVTSNNPQATLVADLAKPNTIPSDQFDCVIFTQTIQMIYDAKAALHTLFRILKPGGHLLLTSHGISKIARRLGRDDWGEYWRITTQSAAALMAETFPGAAIEVRSWGNVLSATAYLHGLAAEELAREELDYCDPDFEVVVSVVARKPEV